MKFENAIFLADKIEPSKMDIEYVDEMFRQQH